jgi:hypothetical protein
MTLVASVSIFTPQLEGCRWLLFQFFGKSGDYLEEVGDDAQVSYLKNIRFRIGIDSYNAFSGGHSGTVLNRTGDAAGNIKVRGDGLTGLANLMGLGNPAGVNCGAGSAHSGAESFG